MKTCQLHLVKPLEEIRKFLFKNKLCYGCVNTLSKDHTGKTCKKRRSYKVCNEKHLPTLHRLKIGRKSSVNGANTRANSQNISTSNTVVLEDDQNENICCNATYTTSNVVSMCVVPVRTKHEASKIMELYAMIEGCSQGTFMDEQLLDELQIWGRKTIMTVKTLNNKATKLTRVVERLLIKRRNG